MEFAQATGRGIPALRLAFTAIICAALAFFGYRSIHWQVIFDPSIMHYVNFLTSHGLSPYRDIIDINLPGAYFLDRLAMWIFGGGDLAWRIYEFCLLGFLIGSMIVISLPYDWFAGLCAGALFTLTHAVEGARNAGQREELMITLILVGYACLFQSLRRRQPMLLLLFGFALGLATSLKPTAALLAVLLPALAVMFLRRQGLRSRAYLWCTVAGFAAAMLIDVWFFWHYQDFRDFLVLSRRLVGYYASIGNVPMTELARTLLKARNLVPLLAAVVLTVWNARRTPQESMERTMLLAGMVFGAVSYIAQRKDFEHHLYSYFALLLLWVSVEAGRAWKHRGWLQWAGVAVFALLILPRVSKATYLLTRISPMDQQEIALQADLLRLGGPGALQHDVLCFDVVSSCYSALYHQQILPYSNLVADYMLFPPLGSAPLPYYRQALWSDLQHRKPRVIVVSDAWLCMDRSFDKLKQWPQIVGYLDANYVMFSALDSGYGAYRVYVRKAGDDLATTPRQPLPDSL